jgi:hypothetical protein
VQKTSEPIHINMLVSFISFPFVFIVSFGVPILDLCNYAR